MNDNNDNNSLPKFDTNEQVSAGNHDRAWNDPPMFSVDVNTKREGPRATKLTGRVAFPIHQSGSLISNSTSHFNQSTATSSKFPPLVNATPQPNSLPNLHQPNYPIQLPGSAHTTSDSHLPPSIQNPPFSDNKQ